MSNLATPDFHSVLLQNRLLTEEIRRRVDQLSAINSVAAMTSQSLDLKATLDAALDSVLHVIPVQAAGISLIDEEAQELVLRAQRGWKHDFVSKPMRIKLGEGLSSQVLQLDKVIVTGDLTGDKRVVVPAFIEEQVQAMALAPMHARGRIIGILSVMNYAPYTFVDEETDVLQAIADQLGVALDNARLYEDTRAKQSRLSAVIDSTADAIIATDEHGTVNLVNSAAENLFGIRAEKLQGKQLRDTYLPAKLRDGVSKMMSDAAQAASVFEITLESGRYLSISISAVHSPEPFPDESLHGGWVMVIQDITHLRDSERNRVRFIQTAAHDMRNPLGVTMSALAMLKSSHEKQPDSEEKTVIDLAITSIDRMQLLIDDLLNLEQIQSGVEVQMKTVDVRDLLERVMLEVQPAIQHKRQHLKMEIAASLPHVQGDIRWLSRAYVNLLTNAHKYTPEGGNLTLRAYHDAPQHEIVIEVEDTGIGIAAVNRKRVFETFYREPKVRQGVPGTGLGLSIVKSVIDQHEGRIYIKSEEGVGSTFGTILPAVIEKPAE